VRRNTQKPPTEGVIRVSHADPPEALPCPSAQTMAQIEKQLYRSWNRLNMTLCREDLEAREHDVLNAAGALVRRWEWLKKQGLWP
jgi:hypothetical protein